MAAYMQIYKMIVNIIFATPDLRTIVILRPIFEKNELNTMAGLENTLSELSAKFRTTKAWTELVIKPTLLMIMPYWLQLRTRCLHAFSLLKNTTMLDMDSFLSLINISTNRSWTTVPPWRAFTSSQWRALEWHSIRPIHWNHLDKAWKRSKWFIGATQNLQTVANWAHSKHAVVTLVMDLQMMTEEETLPKNKHKEETHGRIKSGAMDRGSLRHTLSECIDPMDPGSHPAGALIYINIATGAIAHTSVSIEDSVTLGQDQL